LLHLFFRDTKEGELLLLLLLLLLEVELHPRPYPAARDLGGPALEVCS
jgi:hypothetical protein